MPRRFIISLPRGKKFVVRARRLSKIAGTTLRPIEWGCVAQLRLVHSTYIGGGGGGPKFLDNGARLQTETRADLIPGVLKGGERIETNAPSVRAPIETWGRKEMMNGAPHNF